MHASVLFIFLLSRKYIKNNIYIYIYMQWLYIYCDSNPKYRNKKEGKKFLFYIMHVELYRGEKKYIYIYRNIKHKILLILLIQT